MNLQETIEAAFQRRQAQCIQVLVGGVKDYEQYRFVVGQLRGMLEFYEDIKDYFAEPDSAGDDFDGR